MYHDGISLAEQSDVIWRRLSRLVGQELQHIPVKATRRVIFLRGRSGRIGDADKMASVKRKIHIHLETHLISSARGGGQVQFAMKIRRPTPHDVLSHLD